MKDKGGGRTIKPACKHTHLPAWIGRGYTFFILLPSSFILILFLTLQATSAPQGSGLERIILEHTDTLRTSGGLRHLIGNVRLRRGETVITADRALYDPRSGQVSLTGNAILTEPDRKVLARRMNYNEFTGDFEAAEDVDTYYGDSLRIRCDLSRYNDKEETVDLHGSVIIDDLTDGARITGKHCLWKQYDDSGVIDQDPVYRLPDEEANPPDTLIITSIRLDFDHARMTALFTGNVHLTQDEIIAVADTLRHLPDSSLTILSGAPIIQRDEDELSGRMVELLYEGRKLKKMTVFGDAKAFSVTQPGDPRYNYLAGETLTMTTVDDSTRIVFVEGDALGEYHVWDNEQGYQGVNVSAADTIELTIVSKRTTSIILDGRASGSFYPPEDIPEGVGVRQPASKNGKAGSDF